MTNATIKHGELNLRKVARKAKDGDFVIFKSFHSDSTIGKPYEISDGLYTDDDGDTMHVTGWLGEPDPDIYEVFEETANKIAGLRKVTGRKAIAGDYVVFKRSQDGTPQGEPFEVLSDANSYISHTHRFTINGWGGSEQYDLYEKSPAPKKGDTVKILGLSKYGLNYIGKTGVVDIVNYLNDGHTSVVPTEEGLPIGLYLPENLEVQTEEEKPMTHTFEVGDKVRVLNATNGRYEDLSDGAEGIIDDIDFEYQEAYRVHSEDEGDYDRFEAKDIELIVDAPVEFKVGDYVEVLDASKGMFSDQRDGARGTIGEIAEGHSTGIRVSIDGDFDRYPADALRKLASEAPVTVTVESSVIASPVSFKEGDKVRMISTRPNHGFGEIKTGDIGTVRHVSERLVTADFPKQSYWNGIASEFELVEDELAFEVGGEIRITDISQIDGAHWITQGKTYVIVEIDEDGDIQILDNDGDKFCIVFAEFGGIEKVEAGEEVTPVEDFDQFQPGDKVVLVSGGGRFPLSGFSNGSEYEVKDNNYDHSEGRLIKINKGSPYAHGYALPSQLQKVAPIDEFEQFQPGDKVVVVSGGGKTPLWGYENGKEFFVKSNSFSHSRGRRVQIVKSMDAGSFGGGFALPSQLKLVASPVKGPKFNAGDKAILTSDDDAATCGFRVGDKVTVVGLNPGINDYQIVKEGARGYASDRHLTAVEDAPALKAGDFIEIDFNFVGGAYSLRDITKGKAYQAEQSAYGTGLVFKDDIGDNRGAHIKQGAYKIVDAPAAAKVVEKPYQFASGDYVRFTGAGEIDCAEGLLTNGKIYEVVREDEPGFMVIDDEGDELYIGGYEWEHYEKVDAPAPAPRKLQVGDIVRVGRTRGNRGGSRNEEGDIGLITETNSQSSRVTVSGRENHGNYESNSDLTLIVTKENRQD